MGRGLEKKNDLIVIRVKALIGAILIVFLFASGCSSDFFDEIKEKIAQDEADGTLGQVALPEFSISSGIYSNDQTIEITCDTSGADIYFTTDSSTPTTSSTEYTSPVSITGDGTSVIIKAIAVMTGMDSSNINSIDITINYSQVSTPQFNVASGTYNSDQLVTITTATPAATIHYTTDGLDPTASSAEYTSPVPITGHNTSITLKAIALKTGMLNSSITSGAYTIAYIPTKPTGVTATDGTSTSYVTISWSASSYNTGYYVYRNSSPINSYLTGTSYNDSSAVPGTSYSYQVLAYNSIYALSSALSTANTGYRKLSPPTSVAASDGTYEGYVNITWIAASGATRYYVERNSIPIGNTSGTAYIDSYINEETSYTYRVRSYSSSTSTYSDSSVTNTGYTNVQAYQAEDATIGGGAQSSTTYGGYHGSGYVTSYAAGYVQWSFATTAGLHTIKLRYSQTYSVSDPSSITYQIDGGTATAFSLPGTGHWTNWNVINIVADNFSQSMHTFRITNTNSAKWYATDELLVD